MTDRGTRNCIRSDIVGSSPKRDHIFGWTERLSIVQKPLHPLPLGDTRRPLPGGTLGPFCDLIEPEAVLDRGPLNRDGEFRHRSWELYHWVVPELRDCQRDGLVDRSGFDTGGVLDSIGIRKRDAATSGGHVEDYIASFAVCSPKRGDGCEEMNELVLLIAKFELPTVGAAVLLFLLLRGEVQFRYPRQEEVDTAGERNGKRRA